MTPNRAWSQILILTSKISKNNKIEAKEKDQKQQKRKLQKRLKKDQIRKTVKMGKRGNYKRNKLKL